MHLMPGTTPIEHVIIVVKENHGLDNYFGTFPGANGMAMAHGPNPPRKDPNHRHPAWLTRAKTAPRVQFVEAEIPKYWAAVRPAHAARPAGQGRAELDELWRLRFRLPEVHQRQEQEDPGSVCDRRRGRQAPDCDVALRRHRPVRASSRHPRRGQDR